MIAVGTIAYKRDLKTTLKNIRLGGFHEIIVSAEPDIVPYEDEATKFYQNKKRLGTNGNAIRCYELLLETGSPYVMMVENDVIFNKFAKDSALAKIADEKEFGYISLYTPILYKQFIGNQTGWVTIDAGWGNCTGQATIFPADILRKILQDDRVPKILRQEMEGGLDSVFGDYCSKNKLKMFYHVPSFADHVGDISTRERVRPRPLHRGLDFML